MMKYEKKQNEIDLMDYWQIVLKRKWILIAFAGSLVVFTGIFSFAAKPQFKSTATLMIEDASARMLSMEESFAYRTPVFRDLTFFNTQIRLIKSKSLADRVVKKMDLLSRPEFNPENKNKSLGRKLIGFVTLRWLFSGKKGNNGDLESDYPSNPYSDIARTIRDNIKIDVIRDTKLVEVSYTSSDSRLSAELVNTLAEEFISFSIEKRFENTQQASDFLKEQISTLREDLASKERELQKYGEEKELVFLNDQESTVLNTFADLNQAYTQARIERIRVEGNYRELRNLDVDTLPEFVNIPSLQALNTEYTRLKSDYNEKIKVFKPEYPDMVQLKARIDSMKDEIKNAFDALAADYSAASRRERNLLNTLNKQKTEVSKMKSDAIVYNSLKIEVDNIQNILSSLIEKQSETLISSRLGGVKASNISIIDRAEVSDDPVSPKKKLNLILALLFGLSGGIGLCFLLEHLDNTIKGPEDVERISELSSLGIISYLPPNGLKKQNADIYAHISEAANGEEGLSEVKEVELINHKFPKVFISEDYRTLRTSLLLSRADNPPKTILFTSAMPKAGKTSTATNMAVAFAQLEKKVLLIDSDLRKPRLHRIFKTENQKGLSGYLTGKNKLGDSIKTTSVENIWLLSSGLIPPNPAELLNSKKMNMLIENVQKDFDVVLIDSPPVLAVVDAVIVASLVDTTVFVIKAGETTYRNFAGALEQLKKGKADIAGVVFNEVKVGKGGYSYMSYYNYSRAGYYLRDRGKS